MSDAVSELTKAERTARRVVEAASALFFAQGFADTTIAEVAEKSGVAVGTVMLHFGSKAELATAAFSFEIADVVRSSVTSWRAVETGQSIDTDLGRFVRPIYTWYRKHEEHVSEMLQAALFTTGPWGDHYVSTVADTIEVFAEIASLHTPERDALLVGEGLLADYLIVLLRGLRGVYPSVDAQVERFVALATTRFGS